MQDHKDTIFSGLEYPETEASLLQRVLTGLIDFVIDVLIICTIYMTVPGDLLSRIFKLGSLSIIIVVVLLAVVYRFIFLRLFNKTIGMMMVKVKFLNKERKPLSDRQKFFCHFSIKVFIY